MYVLFKATDAIITFFILPKYNLPHENNSEKTRKCKNDYFLHNFPKKISEKCLFYIKHVSVSIHVMWY